MIPIKLVSVFIFQF